MLAQLPAQQFMQFLRRQEPAGEFASRAACNETSSRISARPSVKYFTQLDGLKITATLTCNDVTICIYAHLPIASPFKMDLKARDLPLKFIMAMGLACVSAAQRQARRSEDADRVVAAEHKKFALVREDHRRAASRLDAEHARLEALWGPHAQADASSTK